MLRTLDHIVVAVANLAEASDRYGRLLGRRPSWRGRHPAYGTANTIWRLDNTYLELLAAEGEEGLAAQVTGWIVERGEGLFALAFGTDDAAACAAELRSRGLATTEPLEGTGRDDGSGAVRRWRNVVIPPQDVRGVRLFAIEHLSPSDLLPAAPAAGDAAAAVSGCDHVVIATGDADATKTVYGERLGLRLALDRIFEQWGVRLLFFRIGGVTVEVAAGIGGGEDPGIDRLWGVSWQVANVEAARERLAAAGFDVSEARTGRRPGTRVCTVRSGTHGVATLLIGPER